MALQKREQELIERWIEQQPRRPDSAEARLVEFGVPVWALVGYLEAVDDDVAQVAADYEVPREAVEAALAYYRQHRQVIGAHSGECCVDVPDGRHLYRQRRATEGRAAAAGAWP